MEAALNDEGPGAGPMASRTGIALGTRFETRSRTRHTIHDLRDVYSPVHALGSIREADIHSRIQVLSPQILWAPTRAPCATTKSAKELVKQLLLTRTTR